MALARAQCEFVLPQAKKRKKKLFMSVTHDGLPGTEKVKVIYRSVIAE